MCGRSTETFETKEKQNEGPRAFISDIEVANNLSLDYFFNIFIFILCQVQICCLHSLYLHQLGFIQTSVKQISVSAFHYYSS